MCCHSGLEVVPMVGRQTIRMDSGNGPLTVMDESPTSSPNSSPSPDMLSTESRRTEALSRSRVVPGSSLGGRGRPAAANAARERSRVQTLRHAFLELQRTLPSVPPDTKLSKLDVLILATTYIAHLTRTLQEEGVEEGEITKQTEALQSLKGDGYLHPVKVSVTKKCNLFSITLLTWWYKSFFRKIISESDVEATQNRRVFCYNIGQLTRGYWEVNTPQNVLIVLFLCSELFSCVLQKWPMRSRLYVGASGHFLGNNQNENQGASSSSSSKTN